MVVEQRKSPPSFGFEGGLHKSSYEYATYVSVAPPPCVITLSNDRNIPSSQLSVAMTVVG